MIPEQLFQGYVQQWTLADAGMPAPMMEMMQDFCSGAFEQHMAGGGDPMDAFDAVGSAIDGLMAPFPNDMPCADMLQISLQCHQIWEHSWMDVLLR